MLAEKVVGGERGAHQGREGEQADTCDFKSESHDDSLDAKIPKCGRVERLHGHPFPTRRRRALIQVKAEEARLRQALRCWVAFGDARESLCKTGAKSLQQAAGVPGGIGVRP
jgi:hypothetical protein